MVPLTACQKEPDLVAVYESRAGSLGLLLRHTIAPLADERPLWREATRRTAAAIVARLRRADFEGRIVVLQWLPLDEVARILRHWTCRYERDAERRAQIARAVERFLADRAFLASLRTVEEHPGGWSGSEQDAGPPGLEQLAPGLGPWYRDMMPAWWTVTPATRRRLVFETHRWVVERVIAPIANGDRPAVEDLSSEGRLARALGDIVAGEADGWGYWIRVVLGDLRQALARGPGRRDETWARWLFLVPYSIPVKRRGEPRAG